MEENGKYGCISVIESGLSVMAALIAGFYAPSRFHASGRTF